MLLRVARLLCEMHELQKTNMTLKRQLTNGAKDEGQDAQGAEQQPARRGADAAAAAPRRQRPKSASVASGGASASRERKRPMTGSVFRAMREMSSVDQNKMMSYMNRVEEQDKELASLRGEVAMLRDALAREMAPDTLNLVNQSMLQRDAGSTARSLRKEARLMPRARPKSAVPVSY